MESSKYIEDLASIKSMMSKSSRFISLSGLSGILAGIYALIAAYLGHKLITGDIVLISTEKGLFFGAIGAFVGGAYNEISGLLTLIILVTLIAAVATGVILTVKKAKRHGEKIWDPSSRRLLINFAIPLATGGIFCMILLQYGLIGLFAPCTLIFYGLALINASKFTLGDIKYLGLANVIIGLISTQYIGYGLYFWALGFGVLHIIYGSLMYFKYDRN